MKKGREWESGKLDGGSMALWECQTSSPPHRPIRRQHLNLAQPYSRPPHRPRFVIRTDISFLEFHFILLIIKSNIIIEHNAFTTMCIYALHAHMSLCEQVQHLSGLRWL
jgi:hypothetical protein